MTEQSTQPPLEVLVVDDDSIFRERLIRALISRGMDSMGAGDAEEALSVARKTRPRRAVVDLKMPGMNGLDLVPLLVESVPGIRIVVLTGYGSIATAVEAVKRGAADYLTKPVDTDQIMAALGGKPIEISDDYDPDTPSLARVEWEHIQRTLSDCDGNISLAARKLGIHRRSLQRKLGRLPPLE
ncbi:MAG: response regulator transcription factor [Phycisphaerae bacterium]